MNIEIGQFYINKTWRFLLPCLRGHGDSFVERFNPVFKLAVGIYDTTVENSKYDNLGNIYILCDTAYQPKSFNNFLNWLKFQNYYVTDYSFEPDIQYSRKRMVVIQVPKDYKNSYIHFIKSEYSKMYSTEILKELFSNPAREKEFNIISKNDKCRFEFLNLLNQEFNTEIELEEFEEDFKEFELPLKRKEEVFNCKETKEEYLKINHKLINNYLHGNRNEKTSC